MNREHMMDRLYAFLREHSPDPGMQTLLAAAADCRAFWITHYPAVTAGDRDEHGVAVRLSYLLAARAHGLEPHLALADHPDAEIAMKSRMEDRGVLAFSAFDD